jgi:hypothetical protein
MDPSLHYGANIMDWENQEQSWQKILENSKNIPIDPGMFHVALQVQFELFVVKFISKRWGMWYSNGTPIPFV